VEKYAEEERNLGNKKVQDVLDTVQLVHLYGWEEESHTDLARTRIMTEK
jgi:hypothetical protein